jgi:hypothetical protein
VHALIIRHKMKKPYLIIVLAIVVAVAFPRFSQQGLSHQEFLWTSEWMKTEYPTPGFRIEIGHTSGALMWNRARLGFPLGATTIDSRISDGVIQGRVETSALLFNVLLLALPACILCGFLTIAGRIKHSETIKSKGEQE